MILAFSGSEHRLEENGVLTRRCGTWPIAMFFLVLGQFRGHSRQFKVYSWESGHPRIKSGAGLAAL
ncbi:MAG: hypothetical protein HYS70_00530 [Nitrospinae bacterium]|nr:hypothetical protein [Nitrospinota bacterium]